MTPEDISNIALTIIGTIGTAGAIVFGLSTWLGKFWADKLLASEQQKYEKELANLRSDLESKNQEALANIKHQQEKSIEIVKLDLNIFKEKHLKGFNDKIQIYRLMIDVVAEVLGDFDSFTATGKPFPQERFDSLNRARIRIYGYIGMIAPQAVMDAQDQLIDYLLQVAHGGKSYEWLTVREYGLVLINEIRKDIGIDIEPITYNGKL
ncbi:MAG: hypothetical protein Q8Q76_12915 [Methylotenera sp.]|nr:hypothetical protein [Methylotenera sp.]